MRNADDGTKTIALLDHAWSDDSENNTVIVSKTMKNTAHQRIFHFSLLLIFAFGLSACATNPYSAQTHSPQSKQSSSVPNTTGHPGLAVAQQMIGIPYRYGGANPRGFDCSGLVYYSYRRAGYSVPRTSYDQFLQSQPVHLSKLMPGDLIFFRLDDTKPSHVGIYEGEGRFVHAPSSGKQVSYASLESPYWGSKVIGAGRF